jgi:hypothetical protein
MYISEPHRVVTPEMRPLVLFSPSPCKKVTKERQKRFALVSFPIPLLSLPFVRSRKVQAFLATTRVKD